MPALFDLLKDVGDKNAQPIQVFGHAIGTLADFASAFAGSAITAIVNQLLNQVDPTQAALQQIIAAIQNDFQADKAGRIIDRLTNQVNAQGEALAVLDSLNVLLNSQPPLTDQERADEIEKCISAIEKLSPEDPLWTAVFSDQTYWTDSGVFTRPESGFFGHEGPVDVDAGYGQKAPPSSNDRVFNYTYILPAYLQAVSCFLIVAGALMPTFAKDYADTVIRPAAGLLKARHDKIVNEGINQILPQHWDGSTLFGFVSTVAIAGGIVPGIKVLPPTDQSPPLPAGIGGAIIEYGAVELFSGYSEIAVYNMPFSAAFNIDSTDPAPFRKFQIRVLQKAKLVYNGVGLRALSTIINNLNRLVGDPPLSGPSFGDWSFRHDLSGLPPVVNADGSVHAVVQDDGSIHLRDMVYFIEQILPPDVPQSLFISFRNLLSV